MASRAHEPASHTAAPDSAWDGPIMVATPLQVVVARACRAGPEDCATGDGPDTISYTSTVDVINDTVVDRGATVGAGYATGTGRRSGARVTL
ncbi:hypothetical protein GCM10009682_25130 [Luedemannella flava]|uniref:Uncharacterized protein n=1 Tax=Luedemannella flava TaxID=349316 RepID=A0ABP4Y365_9ACTN